MVCVFFSFVFFSLWFRHKIDEGWLHTVKESHACIWKPCFDTKFMNNSIESTLTDKMKITTRRQHVDDGWCYAFFFLTIFCCCFFFHFHTFYRPLCRFCLSFSYCCYCLPCKMHVLRFWGGAYKNGRLFHSNNKYNPDAFNFFLIFLIEISKARAVLW